jgi:hypothetical protein
VPDEDDPAALTRVLIDANPALEGRQLDSRWAAADHGAARPGRCAFIRGLADFVIRLVAFAVTCRALASRTS